MSLLLLLVSSSQVVSSSLARQDAVNALLDTATPFHERIPDGLKENVYFKIDNALNVEWRSKVQRGTFVDNCGAWRSQQSIIPKYHYLVQCDWRTNWRQRNTWNSIAICLLSETCMVK